MFLNTTRKYNPNLIEAAFTLHQNGEILPDSYLIDMDMLLSNAQAILQKATSQGINLYFMLKQLGRNPYIAKKLIELGYRGAVVVDYKEAMVMMKHHIPIGNVGHLVQIPDACLEEIILYQPEVITVYSYEKIKRIQEIAEKYHLVQSILLRVYDDNDHIYSGQTAGFHIQKLTKLLERIKEFDHIKIAGITSFPCILFNEQTKENQPTPNLYTVKKGIEVLKAAGIIPSQINMPSATCCASLSCIAEHGGTMGEPGHGLSGTTPSHVMGNSIEKPAVVYVSEVSHNFKEHAYCYGGGYYRRSHVENALVGKVFNNASSMKVLPPELSSIDYHFGLSKKAIVGDTVVMSFRFQIFVTRSDVVLVEGLQNGHKPKIVGYYDSLGNKK